MNKLIVILGPTASGKSSLAIKLAKKFNGEIVSADSRQIYRGMDIGTAKPVGNQKSKIKNQKLNAKRQVSNVKCQTVPHHMIDIINPDQGFSLAEYKKRAVKIIKDIQRGGSPAALAAGAGSPGALAPGRGSPAIPPAGAGGLPAGKIPFLVGGTGLYISAIVDNLKIPKAAPNKTLRNKLNKKTNQQLVRQLKKIDPEAACQIDPANKRRLIRALEVCITTKKPFSRQQIKGKPLFDILQIGLKISREKLYKKIDQRVDQMIKAGLIKEVKFLAKKYSWDLPSMSGIGYKQIGMYLRGEIDLPIAIELIKADTRHYARRQMTWFRRDKRIGWVGTRKEAEGLIRGFLIGKVNR